MCKALIGCCERVLPSSKPVNPRALLVRLSLDLAQLFSHTLNALYHSRVSTPLVPTFSLGESLAGIFIFLISVRVAVWPLATSHELHMSLGNGEESAPLITNSCFNLGILVFVDIFLAVYFGPSGYTVAQPSKLSRNPGPMRVEFGICWEFFLSRQPSLLISS